MVTEIPECLLYSDIRYVQKHNSTMKIDAIAIDDDTFALLNRDHLKYLKGKGFLQAKVSKKEI